MRFITPAGLAILLAIPLIIAIVTRRRRLSVRRVAGVFLWHNPGPSAPPGSGPGSWPRAALIRDVFALIALAGLACGLFATQADDATDTTRWLVAGGRAIIGVVIASLLVANWWQKSRP
jgi:hypothetical protein